MNSERQNKFHSHVWVFWEKFYSKYKEIGTDGYSATFYYRCGVCGSWAIGDDETTGPFYWDNQTPILYCSEVVCKDIIK